MRPVARADGLVVREIGDETLVYDTRQHRAHCLNRTAALVFRHSDGTRTAGEIAALVGAGSTPPGADEEAVEMALECLSEAGLLASEYRAPRRASTSRREAIRRVGLGAALLAPIVTSLVVPTPAEAAATCIPQASCSTTNVGQPCYRPGQQAVDCTTRECQGSGICNPF